MKKVLLAVFTLLLIPMAALAGDPDEVIPSPYASLAMCQPAEGNLTEAMVLHRAHDCAAAMQAIDEGRFTKSGNCQGGALATTFAVDAEGNDCPKTWIDRAGEIVALTALFVAGAEAMGADIAGSGGPISELGGKLAAAF